MKRRKKVASGLIVYGTKERHKSLISRTVILLIMISNLFVSVSSSLGQSWIKLNPSGTPPQGLFVHSSVYDPNSNQMIVFGGRDEFPLVNLNNLFRLTDANGIGTPSWIQVTPGAPTPSARWAHTAVYDASNDRMIMFGGGLGFSSPCTNEVWVLTNASGVSGTPAWTQLNPTGFLPAPRNEVTSAVYDAANNKLIIHGGGNCFFGAFTNDVWVLSNANGLGGTPAWTQLAPTGGALNREQHVAGYDSANNRMIVFGGGGFGGIVLNDVWVLSNANGMGGTPAWTQLFPIGGPPPAGGARGAYDPADNRLLVFSAIGGSGQNEVWALDNANGLTGTPTWTQLNPSPDPVNGVPVARSAPTAVYDQGTKRMTVFGGQNPAGLNDVWVLTTSLEVVPLDIKPQSCPNPVNVKSRGVLPVALLGTVDFDVNEVDLASVRLEGVAPVRSGIEDVARPFDRFDNVEEANDCTEEGPDGLDDLTLKFKTQEVVSALGTLSDGQVLILTLTGNLKAAFGGAPIQGQDVVIIKKK